MLRGIRRNVKDIPTQLWLTLLAEETGKISRCEQQKIEEKSGRVHMLRSGSLTAAQHGKEKLRYLGQ